MSGSTALPNIPLATAITPASKILGLDANGNSVLYPLQLLTYNSLGTFKTTDPAPAGQLLNQYYQLIGSGAGTSTSGTYANLLASAGNPVIIPAAAAGYAIINARAYWNGNYWIALYDSVVIPTVTNKIQPWAAQAYNSADQVNYNGQDFVANAATASTDIPGASAKWVSRLPYYDSLISANSVAVSAVSPLGKVATVVLPKNILNVNDAGVQTGYAVRNDGSGILIALSGFTTSGQVPVLPNTTYTLSGLSTGTARGIRYLGNTGTFISGGVISSTMPYTFTTPANCYFVQVTLKLSSDSAAPTAAQIELGSSATAYAVWFANYMQAQSGAAILADNLNAGAKMGGSAIALVTDIIGQSPFNLNLSKNLFNINSSAIVNGSAVNSGTGIIGSYGASFGLSGPCPVTAGQTYTLSGVAASTQRAIQFQNAAGAFVGFAVSSSFPFTFTVPAGATQLVFSIRVSESVVSPTVQLELGSAATAFAAWALNQIVAKPYSGIYADQLNTGAQLAGKNIVTTDMVAASYAALPAGFTTIVGSGTSIMYGIGSSGGNAGTTKWISVFNAILSAMLGRTITVVNGGISGQTTGGMLSNLPALLSANTPQIVLLEASINDAKTDGNGQTQAQTEANLTQLVTLVKNAGAVPIIFTGGPIDMTVSTVSSVFTLLTRNIVNATARKVAKATGVRLVDIDTHFGGNLTWLNDGLHPNDLGHDRWATIMTTGILY